MTTEKTQDKKYTQDGITFKSKEDWENYNATFPYSDKSSSDKVVVNDNKNTNQSNNENKGTQTVKISDIKMPFGSINFSAYKLINFLFGNSEEKNIVNLLKKSKNFSTLKEITIFDVGCYIGKFSKNINTELTKISNKPINYYLFDPNKNVKELLKKNIEFDYNYYQLGLDNSNTVKNFYLNTNFPAAGSSLQRIISSDKFWNATRAFILGKTNKLFKVYKVQTQSVDKFCSINNVSKIDILKIDVEGNEINVIQGAIKKLNSCSIIYAEVIDQKKLFDKKFAQLKQTLEENNFILLNVKNILSVSIFSHLKAVDTTFVHKNLLN